MARYRGVILDVDGTLVDSNDAHARSWCDALAQSGQPVEFEEVRRRIGMGGDKLLPAVTGISADSPEGEALAKLRKQIFHDKYLPKIRSFPKSRELLERMRDQGLALVVASSAQQDELEPLLEIAGVHDLLASKTSADDAEHSKPDPDIVAAALEKLGCPAEQAVMIGDTPFDITAAKGAGIGTIAFRSGGWTTEELAAALAVYDGPADLLARFDDSPLAP